MTRIAPEVLSSIVDALTPRVRQRVDAYLADGVEVGAETVLGASTVRMADVNVLRDEDEIVCDCLLAPRCAHRAVVALSLEVADGCEDDEGGEAASDGASDSTAESADARRGPAVSVPVSAAQRETALAVVADLATILQVGTAHLGAAHRSALARDLHGLRAAGLVTADRALTAYYQNLSASPQVRASAFASALINLHLLSHLGPDEDARALLGRARGTYRKVGGLSVTPLFAAPVIATSGFAGAEATFADASGRTWSVARLRPGDAVSVGSAYDVEPVWRELSAPIRVLSRRRLLVAGATARDDGRLGAGATVRASLAAAPEEWWESVPAPFEVVEGEIRGGDRSGLDVSGRFVSLSETARALGAGLATELFGQALGTRVRCLAREDELLGMVVISGVIVVPDELGGVWWPGLDLVDRSWAGTLPEPASDGEEVRRAEDAQEDAGSGPAQVREVLRRWCQRVVDAGPSVLSSPVLDRDAAWVRGVGAPFAAELLQGLEAATHEGARRFDGTWEPDRSALALAWLAASQY